MDKGACGKDWYRAATTVVGLGLPQQMLPLFLAVLSKCTYHVHIRAEAIRYGDPVLKLIPRLCDLAVRNAF